ncbi:MAG: hypothetical protein ACRECY_00230 [Phyllobacterium sp.]
MRAVSILVGLSLLGVAGCTTGPKATSVANSPVKDTSFVPPPKSLMQRATPEKKLTLEESVAKRRAERGLQ